MVSHMSRRGVNCEYKREKFWFDISAWSSSWHSGNVRFCVHALDVVGESSNSSPPVHTQRKAKASRRKYRGMTCLTDLSDFFAVWLCLVRHLPSSRCLLVRITLEDCVEMAKLIITQDHCFVVDYGWLFSHNKYEWDSARDTPDWTSEMEVGQAWLGQTNVPFKIKWANPSQILK